MFCIILGLCVCVCVTYALGKYVWRCKGGVIKIKLGEFILGLGQ